jgi:hypothetical protein
MCYCAFKLSTNALIYIVGFGLVTFFYAIPFLPKRFFLDSQYNLRNVGGLKVHVIAMVWTGVTVLLPLINYQYMINADITITAIQRFVFIIILMFPFEIRDMRYDSLKLATIPQRIGVKQTKIIGFLLLVLFFFLEFFKDHMETTRLVVVMLISIITGLFIFYSKKEQGKYYSSFWVEGLPIIWLLLMFVLNCFDFL